MHSWFSRHSKQVAGTIESNGTKPKSLNSNGDWQCLFISLMCSSKHAHLFKEVACWEADCKIFQIFMIWCFKKIRKHWVLLYKLPLYKCGSIPTNGKSLASLKLRTKFNTDLASSSFEQLCNLINISSQKYRKL